MERQREIFSVVRRISPRYAARTPALAGGARDDKHKCGSFLGLGFGIAELQKALSRFFTEGVK
jgi:hypothetical protein